MRIERPLLATGCFESTFSLQTSALEIIVQGVNIFNIHPFKAVRITLPHGMAKCWPFVLRTTHNT